VSKNLKIYLDTDLKIILLDHENNYVKCLNIDDKAAKSFNILATRLNAGLKKIMIKKKIKKIGFF